VRPKEGTFVTEYIPFRGVVSYNILQAVLSFRKYSLCRMYPHEGMYPRWGTSSQAVPVSARGSDARGDIVSFLLKKRYV